MLATLLIQHKWMRKYRGAIMADKVNNPGTDSDQQGFITAINALREHVSTALDQNDLGRLAQMHTSCQTLSALEGAGGELATVVANLLEGVILKEAADANGGLALIQRAVEVIGHAVEGQAVDCFDLIAQIKATVVGGEAVTAETAVPAKPEPEPVAQSAPEPSPAAPEVAAATTAPAIIPERYVAEPLIVDMDEREHLDGFIEESREHMDAIEVALLDVEKDPTNTTTINELFRPFHTIKGIAGFLNLRDINRLTHEMETILDLGRKNELAITNDTIDLFFAGVDVLKEQINLLANYMNNPSGDSVPQPDIVDIMARLQTRAAGQAAPSATASEPSPATEAVSEPETETQPVVPSAPSPAATPNASAPPPAAEAVVTQAADTSIRVDTAKLDFLVDAVGELVIAQTMVNLSDTIATDEKLTRDVSQVSKIVRDVQETAMAMRMVPVGHTFQKMRRLVRDVSRKADKQVELVISGEETELDKNVIQAIADPLVHMVRNSVDHGIEPADVRRAVGKPETGTVHLNAHHQGDSIVIEIRDDGRGLDREKLIAKGIERGLVSPGEQLTDNQVYGLVLQAGFSTAEKITDISGRGVGMDVVKRNVEKLRGKIEIASELGKGSTFSVRLPLTLAIIDGMLVRLGNERLIIPTIMIEQTLRPEAGQITQVQRKGSMIQVRGELITLIQIGPLFGFSEPIDPTAGSVVIAQTETNKIGIVVDELIGQQQVVIKTLGERFKQAKGISGAAILGDGHVGLILEPTGLLGLHNSTSTAIHYASQETSTDIDEPTVEDSTDNCSETDDTFENTKEDSTPESTETEKALV